MTELNDPIEVVADLVDNPSPGQAAVRAHAEATLRELGPPFEARPERQQNFDKAAFALRERLAADVVVNDDPVTGSMLGYDQWPESYVRWLRRRSAPVATRMRVDFNRLLYVRSHTPAKVHQLGDKLSTTVWTMACVLHKAPIYAFHDRWSAPFICERAGIVVVGSGTSHRSLALRLLGATASVVVERCEAEPDEELRAALAFWEPVCGAPLGRDDSCEVARMLCAELSDDERAAIVDVGLGPSRGGDGDEKMSWAGHLAAALRYVRGQRIGVALEEFSPSLAASTWENVRPSTLVERARVLARGFGFRA